MTDVRTVVIGSESCILGFALLGIPGRVVSTSEELDQALKSTLSNADVGIVLISSDAAALQRERVDRLKVNSITPLVGEIPGQDASKTMPSLKELVQSAVGISLGK